MIKMHHSAVLCCDDVNTLVVVAAYKKGCKSRYGPLLTNIETVGNLYGYQGQPSQNHWASGPRNVSATLLLISNS